MKESNVRALLAAIVTLMTLVKASVENSSLQSSCTEDPSSLQLVQRVAHKHHKGAAESGDLVNEQEASKGDSEFWWDWWIPLEVSVVFYRPHYDCGSPYIKPVSDAGNASHVGQWLEEVMTGTTNSAGRKLRPPDFIGLSEMESLQGLPGGSTDGFGKYKVIGSVCKGYTDRTKYLDPIGLYYDASAWEIVDSYPSNAQKCGKYPPPPYDFSTPEQPFDCAEGQTSPGDESCCVCTQSPDTSNATFYGNAINGTYFNYQGTRPFVAAKFKNKRTRRKICVVAFNLPHQMLANCSWSPTAACFSNEAMNMYRIGTGQLTKAMNELCEDTPMIFAGDTNNAAGSFATSFMFYNPNNPNVAKNAKACSQPSPVASLNDPHSDLGIQGQPYTCCNDAEGLNLYASDRIAASGPSWSAIGGFFVPKHLSGGSKKAGEPIADPGSVGTGSSCPGVDSKLVGYPCCGCKTEHAPVWGVFDLFGGSGILSP